MEKMKWWFWSVGIIDQALGESPYCWTGIVSAKSYEAAKERARAYVLDLAMSESAWDPDDEDRTWTIDDYDDVVHLLRKNGLLIGADGDINVVELTNLAEGIL